jgi:hypothetical protein
LTAPTKPSATYVVRIEDAIAGSLAATRGALAGLRAGCEVLGTVANLQGHFLVECDASDGGLSKRDLSFPGIAEIELQVPVAGRLVKRKAIPPKNLGFESLSEEWKEELRGRIEEAERDSRRLSGMPSDGMHLGKRGQLEKRTVLTSAQVTAAWARLGIRDPGMRRQWHLVSISIFFYLYVAISHLLFPLSL